MAGQPRMSFDSDSIPERERLAYCRDEFARKVLHVDMETIRERPFRLRLSGEQFGGVRASIVSIKGLKNVRNRRELADGDHQFGAVIPLGGQLSCGSNGDLSVLRPGQLMALSNGQVGSVGSETGGTFLTVLAPHGLVSSMFPSGPPRFGHVYKPNTAALNLMMSYWRMTTSRGAGMSSGISQAAGRHLAELLALAFGSDVPEEQDSDGRRAARLAAAHTDIAEHFADPSYDVGMCARRLGISVRHLQGLLERDGTSFGAELRRLRLERARQMLTDPSLAHSRITDIALDCGFADVSHFNRLFRSRYGETPSGVRTR